MEPTRLVGGDVSVGLPRAAAVFYGDVGHGTGGYGGAGLAEGGGEGAGLAEDG